MEGLEYPRRINYFERRGSAQCKTAIMLAALKSKGQQKSKQKNLEIIQSYYLNI